MLIKREPFLDQMCKHCHQPALIYPQMTLCFWFQDVLTGETSRDRGSQSLTVGGRQNKRLTELKTCERKRNRRINRLLTCRKKESGSFGLKEEDQDELKEMYIRDQSSVSWVGTQQRLLWHSERVQQTTSANTPSVS